jgi:amidase
MGEMMRELSISKLQKRMTNGSLNASSLVETCLRRIDEIDRDGPRLNSVIEVNTDALKIATDLDAEREENGPRGPLHGIPILIKDNIDTADKMPTTCGSLALEGSFAHRDAFIVKNLRDAGAIILGKTNLSEWANFRSTSSSSGWSSRGGLTRNPYVLDRNPCGSSSGSAVAVSANLCSAAIGTETDGSIVCPAQANGIVGLKPTVGLTSRRGIVPISHSQDTAGPMGRCVEDVASMLGAMTGIDPKDPVTKASADKLFENYVQFLDKDGLRGARIGVARNFFGFNHRVDAIMEWCIEIMKKQGAEIVDPANIETKDKYREGELTVLLYEFKAGLNDYLEQRDPSCPVRSLEDVVEFNRREEDRVMPFFRQELFLKSLDKGPLTDEEYLEALKTSRRLAGTEGIDLVMTSHNLDALMAPSGAPAWTTDLVNGDHHLGGSSSAAAVAGYPNITVPAGFVHGLPVGVSFFSGAYKEPTLIRIAYAFEQATKVRQTPQFLPSINSKSSTKSR